MIKVFKVIVKNETMPTFTGHNILAKDENEAIRIQSRYKIGNPIGGKTKLVRVFENNNVRGMVWKEVDDKIQQDKK